MGFFSDPATASISEDPVLGALALEDTIDELCLSSRVGKNGYKRCNSLDSSATAGPSQDVASPKGSGRRSRKVKPVRRCRSSTNSSMKGHLEEIEAFCQVMQEAGDEKRNKILRHSLKRQSTRNGKESS